MLYQVIHEEVRRFLHTISLEEMRDLIVEAKYFIETDEIDLFVGSSKGMIERILTIPSPINGDCLDEKELLEYGRNHLPEEITVTVVQQRTYI